MDITIHDVTKSFGKVQALQPTDLVLRQHSFTAIVGPSGCGKTTLLRLIAGLETPDQGEMRVGDELFFSQEKCYEKPAHKRNFGMVFQDFALWPHMTVFENVAFGLRAKGQVRDLKRLVHEAIDRVRLTGMEQRYPHQLSGGQQQRVAFARAIVTKPALVLFDEPLSALDAALREEMRVELTTLVKRNGLTVLYVTHDQSEAMTMADQLVVMRGGRILQTGRPEDIYRQPASPFVAEFIGKANWLVKNRSLFRPEQLHWKGGGSLQKYVGTVVSVSYLGSQYETRLQMAERGIWTGYRPSRLAEGEQVEVYVLPQDVCQIEYEQQGGAKDA